MSATKSQILRVHAWVQGRVQGVAFRKSTEIQARQLGLAGWVRNLADGRVEFVAEGAPAAVAALLQWARQGPPSAEVQELTSQQEAPEGLAPPFQVLRP